MKQKVALINAFPSDTFLRELNFADWVIFFTPFREITFAIDREVFFFFSICSTFCNFKNSNSLFVHL